jgi:hypothetical protein
MFKNEEIYLALVLMEDCNIFASFEWVTREGLFRNLFGKKGSNVTLITMLNDIEEDYTKLVELNKDANFITTNIKTIKDKIKEENYNAREELDAFDIDDYEVDDDVDGTMEAYDGPEE